MILSFTKDIENKRKQALTGIPRVAILNSTVDLENKRLIEKKKERNRKNS